MEYGTLKIEIVGLILEENTQIMRAPSIQYLIVDYFGFLDFEPENVETPKSLPKPKAGIKAYFNFMNRKKKNNFFSIKKKNTVNKNIIYFEFFERIFF